MVAVLTDDEYMAFLYDRGARRLGYASYASQCAALDAALSTRLAKAEAERKAAMAAWAWAQLHGPAGITRQRERST